MSLKMRALGATAGAIVILLLIFPPRGATTSGEDTGYGAVAGGYNHTLLVTPQGAVWAWGNNFYGALGNGTQTDRYVPGLVPSLSNIKAVAASHHLSLALEDDGDLWTWGLNSNGQLGDGTTTLRTTPWVVVDDLRAVLARAHPRGKTSQESRSSKIRGEVRP